MSGKDIDDSERSQLSRRQLVKYAGVGAALAAASPLVGGTAAFADDRKDDKRGHDGKPDDSRGRVWRAGDHHVHS